MNTDFATWIRNPPVVVGTVLVLATILSWALSFAEFEAGPVMAVFIVIIAFVKVRLVGRHFMGLRNAPGVLRALFDVYVAAISLAIIAAYLV